MSVNILQNIFVGQLANSSQGPIVNSQVFDERSATYLDVYEWEVFNGAKLVEPLPFGVFGEIKPLNFNKSKLELKVAPGYFDSPSTPVFQEICAIDRTIDQQLEKVVVCRKIVPINSPAETGMGVWDSVIQPIDATHGLRVTRHNYIIFHQRGFTVTKELAIPQRFRAELKTVETTEVVEGTAVMPVMETGDELKSEQQLTVHTKQVVTRTFDTISSAVLYGEKAYEEGVKSNVIEMLFDFRPSAERGLLVISSEVSGLGNGQYIRETHTAPYWPELFGSKFDFELNTSVPYSEQFVSPTTSPGAELNVEYEPVNIDRSLKRKFIVPTATLDNYLISMPVRVNMQLPKILKGITVIWNEAAEAGDQSSGWSGFSIGRSYSLSCNLSDGSSASAAVSPEVLIDLEEIWSSNLPATAKIFYMRLPITEEQILIRLNALRWPVFKPRSHTIIGCGAKISASVRVSVSASSSGSDSNQSKDAGNTASVSKEVSLSNNVIQIGPTIHDQIVLQGDTIRNISSTAKGEMRVSGRNFPTVSAEKTAGIIAAGRVYPNELPAVSGPTRIPTSGIYLIDSQVQPYKWGYAKVYAELLNASIFA